jgi:hypothetical protein
MRRKLSLLIVAAIAIALCIIGSSELLRDQAKHRESVARQNFLGISTPPSHFVPPEDGSRPDAKADKNTLPIFNKPLPIATPDEASEEETARQVQALNAVLAKKRSAATAQAAGATDESQEVTVTGARSDLTPVPTPLPSSDLIGGVVTHAGGVGVITSVSATPSPTPLPRVTGQSRGYAALYLMHPNARAAVEEQVRIMKDAQVRELYLGVLTDGTFGVDFEYLNTVVRALNEDGRVLTLALYLSNGPTMRDFTNTTITGGFSRINPNDFRNYIRYSPQIRAQFRSMVEATVPTFDLNRSLNAENVNYAVVMLEDNLTRDSYSAMRDIASGVLGERVTFVRNPCPDNCWPGNDMDSLGDPLELHSTNALRLLKPGDGLTLDGSGFAFPWENDPTQLSVDQVKAAETQAFAQGLAYFGLWRKQRQGVEQGKINPDLRNYEVPTAEQSAIEIELLRSGLEQLP